MLYSETLATAYLNVQSMGKERDLSESTSTETNTLPAVIVIMRGQIEQIGERGDLAMSLSLRLSLVASFSSSLIISRHLRSRICWTGEIIPAWVHREGGREVST